MGGGVLWGQALGLPGRPCSLAVRSACGCAARAAGAVGEACGTGQQRPPLVISPPRLWGFRCLGGNSLSELCSWDTKDPRPPPSATHPPPPLGAGSPGCPAGRGLPPASRPQRRSAGRGPDLPGGVTRLRDPGGGGWPDPPPPGPLPAARGLPRRVTRHVTRGVGGGGRHTLPAPGRARRASRSCDAAQSSPSRVASNRSAGARCSSPRGGAFCGPGRRRRLRPYRRRRSMRSGLRSPF